jgi:uncharacterized RmlC-like cupin family protein
MSARPSLDLSTLLAAVAGDPDSWQPLVRFDAGSRHWARLVAPPGIDLWLLTWLPDQATDLHDHGDAAAAIRVVRGQLSETRPDPQGRLTSRSLTAGATYDVPAGVIHDVLNPGTERAVSLHAYAPRLTHMTFWSAGPAGLRVERTVRTDEPELAVGA